MMRPTCQSCAHYDPLKKQCRAHAPAVFSVGTNQNGQLLWAGTWPPTQPDNWCGEHRPDGVSNG